MKVNFFVGMFIFKIFSTGCRQSSFCWIWISESEIDYVRGEECILKWFSDYGGCAERSEQTNWTSNFRSKNAKFNRMLLERMERSVKNFCKAFYIDQINNGLTSSSIPSLNMKGSFQCQSKYIYIRLYWRGVRGAESAMRLTPESRAGGCEAGRGTEAGCEWVSPRTRRSSASPGVWTLCMMSALWLSWGQKIRLVNDEDRMASSWCTFKVVGFTVILYVTNVTTSKL